MKTGKGLVLALIAVPVLAVAAEAFMESDRMPARENDLIALHRSVHVYAGYCLGCQDASYNRYYLCRRDHQCVELDRSRIDEHGNTTHRAARRHSLTTDRRIKCVSEHS